MPIYPLSVREPFFEENSAEVEIALFTITHPDLEDPIRLSTDPTERLSVDPLQYGTTSNGETYLYAAMSAYVPDDQKQSPPRTALIIDNVDALYVQLLRSFTTYARADIELVMASDPDFAFQRYRRLSIVAANYDESKVTLEMSREPFTSEPHGGRMSKEESPGLHGLGSA